MEVFPKSIPFTERLRLAKLVDIHTKNDKAVRSIRYPLKDKFIRERWNDSVLSLSKIESYMMKVYHNYMKGNVMSEYNTIRIINDELLASSEVNETSSHDHVNFTSNLFQTCLLYTSPSPRDRS